LWANDLPECSVIALGTRDGRYVFRDPGGRVRWVTAAELRRRDVLLALFLGDAAALSRAFPRCFAPNGVDGRTIRLRSVDFDAVWAARHLRRRAREAGAVAWRLAPLLGLSRVILASDEVEGLAAAALAEGQSTRSRRCGRHPRGRAGG
jgi:hypothetical protein